jgi:aryl-alcohol dehydrogenase-like predicted oxidoreductase
MQSRPLGRSGIDVSVLGYGAWGIGQTMWIGADDEESLQALRRAIELGVNFVDTALGYGNGHSEELVGRVVRESSETVHVATKMPPKNMQWRGPAFEPRRPSPPTGSSSAPSAACATWASRPSTSSRCTCGRTSGSARATGSRGSSG